MKNVMRWLGVLSLVAAFTASSLFAQDEKKEKKEKKGKADPAKAMVDQFMKNLEPAGLKADQKEKIEEMFGKVAKEVATKRSEAGITSDLLKKYADARKEAREAGTKQKEVAKEAAAKIKLTENQAKCMNDTDAALTAVKIEVGKLLSEEQMGKIDDPQFKASLQQKGKNKKKKAA